VQNGFGGLKKGDYSHAVCCVGNTIFPGVALEIPELRQGLLGKIVSPKLG